MNCLIMYKNMNGRYPVYKQDDLINDDMSVRSSGFHSLKSGYNMDLSVEDYWQPCCNTANMSSRLMCNLATSLRTQIDLYPSEEDADSKKMSMLQDHITQMIDTTNEFSHKSATASVELVQKLVTTHTSDDLLVKYQMERQITQSKWNILRRALYCADVHLCNDIKYYQFHADVDNVGVMVKEMERDVRDNKYNKYDSDGIKRDKQAQLQKAKDKEPYLKLILHNLEQAAQHLVPVNLRTTKITEPVLVTALACFRTDEIDISEGDILQLIDNTSSKQWTVSNEATGDEGKIPALFLLIPGPDTHAKNKVDKLKQKLDELTVQVASEIMNYQSPPTTPPQTPQRDTITPKQPPQTTPPQTDEKTPRPVKVRKPSLMIEYHATQKTLVPPKQQILTVKYEVVKPKEETVAPTSKVETKKQESLSQTDGVVSQHEVIPQNQNTVLIDLEFQTSTHAIVNPQQDDVVSNVKTMDAEVKREMVPEKQLVDVEIVNGVDSENEVFVDDMPPELPTSAPPEPPKTAPPEYKDIDSHFTISSSMSQSVTDLSEENIDTPISQMTILSQSTENLYPRNEMGDGKLSLPSYLTQSIGSISPRKSRTDSIDSVDSVDSVERMVRYRTNKARSRSATALVKHELQTVELAESTITEESSMESKMTLISILNTQTGTQLTKEQAVRQNIVDNTLTWFYDKKNKKKISMWLAINKHYVKTTNNKTLLVKKKLEQFGIIDIKVSAVTRYHEVDKIFDTKEGKWLGLDEAEAMKLWDEEHRLVTDRLTGSESLLEDAVHLGLVKGNVTEFSGNDPDAEVRTFIVKEALNTKTGRMIPFYEAVNQGIVDVDEKIFFDKAKNVEIPLADAIKNRLLKADIRKKTMF